MCYIFQLKKIVAPHNQLIFMCSLVSQIRIICVCSLSVIVSLFWLLVALKSYVKLSCCSGFWLSLGPWRPWQSWILTTQFHWSSFCVISFLKLLSHVSFSPYNLSPWIITVPNLNLCLHLVHKALIKMRNTSLVYFAQLNITWHCIHPQLM